MDRHDAKETSGDRGCICTAPELCLEAKPHHPAGLAGPVLHRATHGLTAAFCSASRLTCS